jgi:hypothetical protein
VDTLPGVHCFEFVGVREPADEVLFLAELDPLEECASPHDELLGPLADEVVLLEGGDERVDDPPAAIEAVGRDHWSG